MRIEGWNPNVADQEFENVAMGRLLEAADELKKTTKRNLQTRIGHGKTTGINRPPYRGQPKWTGREFGTLMKSLRVTQKKSKTGRPLTKKRDCRVYAGTWMAYYANIFEHYTPFMRPALNMALPEIKRIIGVK